VNTVYPKFSDVPTLERGCVFACPTDTVYGLSCAVADTEAIGRIKEMKRRGRDMPLVVLVGALEQLDMFMPKDSPDRCVAEDRLLAHLWPGPISIVFRDTLPEWSAITPDGTLALRMPNKPELLEFLQRFGPVVSTSANMHGEKPATTVAEVLEYFPTQLDFVIDGGVCDAPPSTLIKILR
jgi:L-threonylcarbamoyladenylate synthase